MSDQNYLIATPDRRSSTQLCHVNLLKPYYVRVQESGNQEVKLNDVHSACVSVSLSPVVAEQGGDACQALMMLYFMAETEFEWFTQSFGGLRNALSWMV